MKLRTALYCLILFGLVSNGWANVKELGIMGKTYSISESDALQEIRSRAAAVDWQALLRSPENLEKLRNFKPDGIPKLPRAIEDRSFFVDMTYTLEFDIPNGMGGILYPAGYAFNPLDYIDYHGTLVVFDAADPEQIKWVEDSGYAANFSARLLITDGSYRQTASRIDRHVYFAVPAIVNRLQLRSLPSVIRQKGNKMEVQEIGIVSSKN